MVTRRHFHWCRFRGGPTLPRALALPFWLDRPANEALDIAELAEARGFDQLWIGEMATFDAFALAGAIARTTSTVSITVGPVPVTLRDPVALAMGVSSVAELGNRPAHLALGASSATVLRHWHGVEQPASLQRFREVIEVCRALFAGERSDYRGETLHTRGFRLRIGHPGTTISVAAFGPGLLRLAAHLADRVVLAHVSPEQVRAVRAHIDSTAQQLGCTAPQLVVWTQTGFGRAALDQVRRGLVAYLAARGYSDMFTEAGFGAIVERARQGASPKDMADLVPDELVHLVAAVGEPATVMSALDERRRAGADVVVITPATDTEGGVGELLAALGS